MPRAAPGLALAATLVLLGVLAAAGTAHADIYKFTDADGVVHFTNTPNGDRRFRVYIHGNGEGWRAGVAPGVVPVPPSDAPAVTRFPTSTLLDVTTPLKGAVTRSKRCSSTSRW